jgi:predicted amidohydrolase
VDARDATLRVGACQTPEFIGSIDDALTCLREFARQAEAEAVDLLVFPECFLQGYLVNESFLRKWAMALDSEDFADVRRSISDLAPTCVFGMAERDGDRFFNTAVVVRRGELVGVYRKTHLTAGEAEFDPGVDYPVFEQSGIRYGINICYDANFPDAAAGVAGQGAALLLLPAQNMMLRDNAETWKDRHNAIRRERAVETGMWLVSADVTGSRDPERVGWGPTCVIDPAGTVVAQVPLGEVGMVSATIPGASTDHALNSPGRGWIQGATE